MQAVTVAVMSVFAVCGFWYIAEKICAYLLDCKSCDRIVMYVSKPDEKLEYTVRSQIMKNPNAEIVIEETACTEETRKIAEHLAECYPQVYLGELEIK